MDKEKFEGLVARALDNLPDEFHSRLENVDVVIEEKPSSRQLTRTERKRGETLLGLYEGVPLTERGAQYGMVIPDKISIFQIPIEESCRSDSEIITMIQQVVRHEIAHHFGISDDRLKQLGIE